MAAATIVTLRTREDRLREDQAAELRQLVLAFPGLPELAVGAVIAAIDRQTVSSNGWTFVMISPHQNAAVVRWIMEHSSRPMKAAVLWSECFMALRMDTGEIMLRRDELADRVQLEPQTVSALMSELETCGAIIRRRDKISGLRGRGIVRYFMNPRVGTHLTGAARDRAQDEAPLLALLGKQDIRSC
jgi:hypothetical protein